MEAKQTRAAPLNRANKTLMIDFHGCSVEEAKRALDYNLQLSRDLGVQELRVVTGRGNHVNARGERGTLFQEFPTYLSESSFNNRVKKCEARDGHYILYLHTTGTQSQPDLTLDKVIDIIFKPRMKYIEQEAESGHPFFMVLFGEFLEKGQCEVNQDIPRAVAYYRKAAEAGSAIGMQHLGRCFFHGVGVKQSDSKALEWVQKAHIAGIPEATVSLASWYYEGFCNIQQNKIEGLRLYHEAIKLGSTDAMRFIATIFREEHKFRESFELYKRAADLGDVLAQYNTGVCYHLGQGVERNDKLAMHYLGLAAHGGDCDAQFCYGIGLLNSRQPPNNVKDFDQMIKLAVQLAAEGLGWIQLAAQNGSAQANAYLARSKNNSESNISLKSSAKAGNIFDQRQLEVNKHGDLALLNIDTIRYEDVLPVFKRTTDSGLKLLDYRSQFIVLDVILLHGKSDEKMRAYEIIKSMAVQKCPYSKRRIIYFLQRGDSLLKIKKSIPQVIQILEECVQLKDPIAMTMLSTYYLRGEGCAKSTQRVTELLDIAIQLGYPPAYYHKAKLLEERKLNCPSDETILEFYRKAIELEEQPKLLGYFRRGPMDAYEIVTAMAKDGLARISLKLKPSQKLKIPTQPSKNKAKAEPPADDPIQPISLSVEETATPKDTPQNPTIISQPSPALRFFQSDDASKQATSSNTDHRDEHLYPLKKPEEETKSNRSSDSQEGSFTGEHTSSQQQLAPPIKNQHSFFSTKNILIAATTAAVIATAIYFGAE